MKSNGLLESWIFLGIGIIFGVLGTISMKLSYGLKHQKHTINLIFFYTISFIALTFAIKHIELSIVYAVWSGLGTMLVSTIGMIYFNESASIKKILYLLIIVVGVIGIHLSDVL